MDEAVRLGEMLRSWRGRLRPEDVGSPFGHGSGRTPGLRREEVAWLAGVSPDYVKRLEQGNAHPSSSVVRALARALRLSPSEYDLACRLAGHATASDALVPQRIGESVQRLLDRLDDTPIAVFDAAWTRLDQNDLWTALTGDSRGHGSRADNIVWRSFLGDPGRVRHPELDAYRRSIVADLQAVVSHYPADRELASMVAELRAHSPAFSALWVGSAVDRYSSERKIIDHPELGALELDCDVLSVHESDLRVIVFSAAPGSVAAAQLRLLAVVGTQTISNTVGR